MERSKMKLTAIQKDKIVRGICKASQKEFGDIPPAQILEEMPKVFEALKKGEEYDGDIILMFFQEQIKQLIDQGYEW